MPAQSRYEPVHVQLRCLAARARARGLTFADFWREALRPARCARCEVETLLSKCPSCHRRLNAQAAFTSVDRHAPETAVRFPTDTADKRASIAALEATKEGWRRAYAGDEPVSSESALILLAPILAVVEQVYDERYGTVEGNVDSAGGIEPVAEVA
ncbi:MAG: hypothetical protein LC798_12810 [Chloroflexi bacterium]|nr:hypothetical protein [Chloroflexota bacterium]